MNRNTLTRLIMALFMVVLVPLTAMSEHITYTASYDLTQQIGTDTLGGITYTTLQYGELFNSGAPGAPSLPVDYIRFSVPYNATNFRVTTTQSNMVTYYINHMMYPCQPLRMMSDTTPVIIRLPDNAIYNSGQFYPTQQAWVVNEGFLAGENHIVTVAVMPFTYQHTSTQEKLRKYKKITVNLSYELSNRPFMSPILSYNSNSRNEGFKLTQSMVVNPTNVTFFAPNSAPTDTLFKPYNAPTIIAGMTAYPYLIITVPEFVHSLRRLVALKKQKGYNVKLVTVDEIMNDPYAQYGDIVKTNGVPTVTYTDNAGIIREYLKLARWYNQTKYLLLAGTNVPYRVQSVTIPLGHYDVPTDLYYSDLNSNWFNSNDSIDTYPEIFVGRLLAKKDTQITDYTDKLFRYELNPGKGNLSYLKRALYLEFHGVFNYSRVIGEQMNQICPDSVIMRELKYHHYPKGCDVVDTINTKQFGFMCAFNHGSPSNIVTYGLDYWGNGYSGHMYRLWAIDTCKVSSSQYQDHETGNGLNKLMNKDYPSIFYSTSCRTMPYDISSPTYNNLPMNFGESFTTGKDYGGPAYLGNTRDGIINFAEKLAGNFGKHLIYSKTKIGLAEALSKIEHYNVLSDLYIALTHNLLGDPTLEMWKNTPQLYSNVSISRSNNSISISGIDADSTIVAFYSNDGSIGTDTVSSANFTINAVSPNSSIMLYKNNHIPYIAPLELQNVTLSNSQYVIASEVTAGKSVNTNRTNGNVIVPDDVEYEIEASGKVILEDGFQVEKGATFAVYPACF